MKKLVLVLGLVCSGLVAQTLPNGWIAGPTTPSTCQVGNSADFYNWTTGIVQRCSGTTASYGEMITWNPVTVLAKATAATPYRVYRFTAATAKNVCPDVGDSGGTNIAFCVSNGTHYQAAQFSSSDGVASYYVGGALVIPGQAVRPTCDSGHRFWFWTVTGSSGTADTVAVCAGDNGTPQVFAWRTIY